MMVTVYDVPPEKLIHKISMKLKENTVIIPPEWSKFVKTGRHRERAPTQDDWWYIRTAAVMRKVYIHSPIGISRLSSMFGGSADRGSKPDRPVKGSRAIIRNIFHQLEKAGYITNLKGKGRVISPSGQKFLDNIAFEIKKEIEKIETAAG